MIIGRTSELQKLKRAYDSEYSEFVAVYGRRRVGKTFLIREAFNYTFTFSYTGEFNASTKQQLANFHAALIAQGAPACVVPKTWPDAFRLLANFIEQSKDKRKVIFLDELPWMDAPRSGFVSALEHFWNGWATARRDVLLIICGSASSWIIDKVFRNRGGLHNRVTYRMSLQPFSLAEVEEYATANNLNFSRNQIVEGYMVMGGVPFYWSKLDASKSMAQNVNDLFMREDGEFRFEFNDLYHSIFNRPEKYIAVIEALATKRIGLTRDEIIRLSKLENNGQLSKIIEELVECGFVRKYCHTDKKVRDAIYQLVDCYTLFYYQFVKNAHWTDEEYWLKIQNTPTYHTWCGLAFERVCLLHTRQIKVALGISGILSNIFSWRIDNTDEHPGVQVDLLIDRADNVVTLFEMKYAPNGYTMTRTEADKIATRVSVFSRYAPRRKAVQLVMITSNGFVGKSRQVSIQKELTADDLFCQ